MRTINADDGRTLDVMRAGADSGPALLMHHGTPSDATLWLDWHACARAAGLQLLAVSRPGYAVSTRRPGRRVADVVDDARVALDAIDAPWFVTAGWSGGGPHALACAALLGDRCRGAATLAGVAPFSDATFDWLDGMGPENHAEFGAARAGDIALRTWLEENASAMHTTTAEELSDAFGGLIDAVDREALENGFAESMSAEMRRALAAGFDGWIDDDLAFVSAWGFDLAAIEAPVTIWQGDRDLMVPVAHARALAERMPHATRRHAPGHGHISLITTYREEIVNDLMNGRRQAT